MSTAHLTRPAWLVPSLLALTSCTAVIAAPEEGQLPPPGAIKSIALPMPMGLQIQQNRPSSNRPGILAVTPGSNVIFLNFDGQALRPGQCSDSATGCTFITTVSTNFPAFGGSAAQKDQIVSLVRQYFARYNVTITTTRPTGVYTMCLIGGSPQNIGMQAGAAGVAPLDCGDSSGADIVFAFSEVTQNEPNAIATTVAQEVAHAYGLGHTNVQADIMYPYLNNATTGFLDQTMTTPDQSFCPGVAQQNSHRDMVRMLGAATGAAGAGGAGAGGAGTTGGAGAGGTDAPPRVAFTAPGENATVPSEFQLNIDAADDRGVQYVDIYLDRGTPGEQTARLMAAPFSARVTNLPAGRHTLDAIATDTGGQNASARVSINVGDGAAGSTGTAGTGGGTAGAGGGTAGAGGGTAGAGGGTAGGAAGGTAGAGGGTAGGAAGGTAPTPGAGGQTGSTPKGMGETCIGPVDCASGICLNDRANSRQYCSRDCTDGMCPVGAECVAVDTVKACVFKAAPAGAAGSGATAPGAEMHLVGNCAAAPGGATRGGFALLLPLLLLLRRRRAR